MTKQARNYSIKNDSMSYFPGEHMTGPPTDASVSTEGEIKPLQAICCKASAREGS